MANRIGGEANTIMKGRGIGRGSRCRQQEELRKNWRGWNALNRRRCFQVWSSTTSYGTARNRNTLDRRLNRKMTSKCKTRFLGGPLSPLGLSFEVWNQAYFWHRDL